MSTAVTFVDPDSPTGLSIDSSPRIGGGRCDAEAVCGEVVRMGTRPVSPPKAGCEYAAVWQESESSEHVLMFCYFIYNQVTNELP